MRTILFDGDVLAYQIGFATERVVEWPNGLTTMWADRESAGLILDEFLAKLMHTVDGKELIVVLSDDDDSTNFRYKLAADYKATRKGKRKPMLHPYLRQYMKDGYEVYQRPTLEGDDTLGILLTSDKIVKGDDNVCVSIDKDLASIPGLHYNTNKPDAGIVRINEFQADYNHLIQTLMGDTVDNYPGCKGVGRVKAARILGGLAPLQSHLQWAAVVQAYAKAGLGEEEALRQARLARILRNTDYDFKKKEVILWTPKPTTDT